MKWLEGWFGTLSGGLGAVIVAIVALVTPAYTQSQSCATSNGVTTCYSAYGPGASSAPIAPLASPIAPGPQPFLLIPVAITLLLFIGVLVGTWLDLGGKRTTGRLILLISASLLWLFNGSAMPGAGFSPMLVLPLMLLAFVAGILACVRPDAPKPVAAPAQAPVSE
ncbi:MAG TPA: hypothetical protein VFN78_08660 [Ktedonobacterales bacterium]|nr:hypothetical protein [Ktedonobacterales bacterium]